MGSCAPRRRDREVASPPVRYSACDLRALALDLVTIANQSESPQVCLQVAIDRICDFTESEVGHAFVGSADAAGKLRSAEIWNRSIGPEMEAFRKRTAVVTFRSGEGLVGRAVESRAPVWITDYAGAHMARSQAAGECGIVTGFGIPIVTSSGYVSAVIEFYFRRLLPLDPELTKTLVFAAGQMGRVFERAEREAATAARIAAYEAVMQTHEAVRHVDKAIASHSVLSATLDIITEKLVELMGVDSAHVLLCDGSDRDFEILPTVSPPDPAVELPSLRNRNDPARRAALTHEVIHYFDTRDLEPHEALPEYMVRAGIRGYHAVPLIVDDCVQGVLELCDRQPRPRDEAWCELLGTMASQTATALLSACTLNELRRENEMLRAGFPPADLPAAA